MSHHNHLATTVAIAVSLFTSMVGAAIAITMGLLSGRQAKARDRAKGV